MKIVQTIAACLTVWAAFRAINTWKHQSKAQKQTDFLDELTDRVHKYIQVLSRPNQRLEFISIGFESHRNTLQAPDGTLEQGAIAYIEKHGVQDSKNMWADLEPSTKQVSKINALVARGQVYQFAQYQQCRDSIKMLVLQHQRLQTVALMVGSTDWNWEHPAVQKTLANILAIKSEDVARNLEEYDRKFLDFVNANYQRIYAST